MFILKCCIRYAVCIKSSYGRYLQPPYRGTAPALKNLDKIRLIILIYIQIIHIQYWIIRIIEIDLFKDTTSFFGVMIGRKKKDDENEGRKKTTKSFFCVTVKLYPPMVLPCSKKCGGDGWYCCCGRPIWRGGGVLFIILVQQQDN